MAKLSVVFKSILTLVFISLLLSCTKELVIEQSVSNGSFIESVNGKPLTCTVKHTTINAGQDIIFTCTNETDFNATIDVKVNGQNVGTIDTFPAEFHHLINDAGVYQFSISGSLKSKNLLEKMTASFSYSWSITVYN